MKINAEIIKKLNPCDDRFNNYLSNYKTFEGDLTEFVSLENITYSDKVWVVTKLFTRDQNVRWSIACAESVMHHFTAKYPENKSLQNLFDYLKTFETFENITQEQKDKIIELRSAAADAAYAAAYAADAAYAAADAAYAAAAREEQRNLNLMLMIASEG